MLSLISMSTRATIHFHYQTSTKPEAIIYRHGDGYPDGLGLDLQRFFLELEKHVSDRRFNDPSYLAAKWVVWDADQMAQYTGLNGNKKKHKLAFLSVGVVMQDPGDIEYRYHVWCGKPQQGKDWPEVTCEHVEFESKAGKPVPIPVLK